MDKRIIQATCVATLLLCIGQPSLAAERVSLFDDLPGLSAKVLSTGEVAVIDHELGFRLLLPSSPNWEVITSRTPDGKRVALQVASGPYAAAVSTIANANLSVQEHLRKYLDDLVTSRYVDVRFSEFLEVADQIVLCYQSRLNPKKPWVWTYDLLAPAPGGWHHLVFSETPEDALQPYNASLVEAIARGFQSND